MPDFNLTVKPSLNDHIGKCHLEAKEGGTIVRLRAVAGQGDDRLAELLQQGFTVEREELYSVVSNTDYVLTCCFGEEHIQMWFKPLD